MCIVLVAPKIIPSDSFPLFSLRQSGLDFVSTASLGQKLVQIVLERAHICFLHMVLHQFCYFPRLNNDTIFSTVKLTVL